MYKVIKRSVLYILNFLSGIKYLSINNPRIIVNRQEPNKNIVLISHNAQKAGAPVLLEYIAKKLYDNGYNTVIISRRYGDMIYRFKSVCHTSVCFSKKSVEQKIRALYLLGYHNAICNTVINGDLVEMLKECGFTTISLIHELPNVIEELDAKKMAKAMAIYSDEIIFPSEFVYQKFCLITNFSFQHRIKPQGLYLHTDHIYDRQTSLQKINEMYGYQINSNVILNVATINKRKGFDIFLAMARNDKDNQYIWIGDTNCRYFNRCLNDHHEGIPDNLLLPGYIDDANVLAYFYDIADVFALTSREEPFGTIVLEAFNASTPVVAFEGAGGFIDIVKNDLTGILTEYESVDGMIRSVHYLIDHPQIMQKMMKNCKQTVHDYSFDEYVEFLVAFFKEKGDIKQL